MGPNGPNGPKWAGPIGPGPNGPNGPKWAQMSPSGPGPNGPRPIGSRAQMDPGFFVQGYGKLQLMTHCHKYIYICIYKLNPKPKFQT